MKSEFEDVKGVLTRIEKATGTEGREKLYEDQQVLADALITLERQIKLTDNLCQEAEQIWNEFQLRFDTISSSYKCLIDDFDRNKTNLDEIEVCWKKIFRSKNKQVFLLF